MLALAAFAPAQGCDAPGSAPPTVTLIARAPERGNWSPRTLEVKQGREITIEIRNGDVVTHGFYLPAFGITVAEIRAGEIRRVTFTPDSIGEFPFYCAVWCSDYHMDMRGTLIVR